MRRISAILLTGATVLAVRASASDGIPLSPSDMTSALERKIVSGVGVMYPGSDLESATTPALALLDAEWPDPFLDRIGETISVRVSSTTGHYEFTDESGSVFWIEIPVAPLTWNWVAPFLRPYDPPTQDFSLIAPWHLADRWRLSTEALEELRAVPPLLRSLPLRSAPGTNDVTNLCFTAFTFTETNLYFTAAWPTNDALPDNLLDLYCSTNELDRFRFLLSSHPATNPPISFDIPSALVPNWGCATSHVHDATCPVVTNIVLSPLDGTTIYTNVVYGCAVTNSPTEAAFFRLGSRVDTDGDGLADAYERYVTLTDENRADSDGDGFSDGAEWAAGTNPFDPDTDGDGVPDGQTGAQWLSHPLWARNGDCTNLVIFLYEPVTNGVAVLRFDDLAIPLSTDAGPWCLCIPTNAVVTCRLVSSPGAVVMLWYGPPEAAVPTRSLAPDWSVPSSVAVPIWCDNPMAVFGGNNWGGGVCRFARPTLRVRSAEPGNSEDDLDVCVHSSDLRARFAWSVEPNVCTGLCAYGTGGLSFPGSQGEFFLDVGQAALGESGTQTGTLFVESEQSPFFGCNVLFGTLVETVTAHPCMGWIDDGFGFCLSCGVAHGPPRGASSCLHESLCASKTNLLADCDCSQPFVRIGSKGVYKLVGDLISCCHAHSYASYGAQLLSAPGALHASVGNGSYLAVEPDARSPTIGGFVANYRILDGDGAFYRDLSLPFTCADLGIDPCLSNAQAPYGEDPEAYFVTNGVFYVARRSSPYPLRLWNESPSDALLVLAFAAPTNGPVLRANTTGDPSLVGALSVTNATPFAALNDDATVYLDASCSNSLATLSLELSDPATDRTFLSESLSVQVVDTTIGEHWRVRSATDRIAWDFSDAPEPVWICLRETGSGQQWGNVVAGPVESKTPSFSLDLPPGDYMIEAYFPRVYAGERSEWEVTNTVHVVHTEVTPSENLRFTNATERACFALTNNNGQVANWTISPVVAGGPMLHASKTGGAGSTTHVDNATSVWVQAGTAPGRYTITATHPDCPVSTTNATFTVGRVDVESLLFNWDKTGSARDAINLRWNYKDAINLATGEWTRAGYRAPACYVTNASPLVKATFSVAPTNLPVVRLFAETSAAVGGFAVTNVSFSNGAASNVVLSTRSSATNCVLKETFDLTWKAVVSNETEIVTNTLGKTDGHVFYTILDEPEPPWVNNTIANQNAWVSALEIVCSNGWAKGSSSLSMMSAYITTAINESGRFEYDVADGDVNYTDDSGFVHLSAAIDRIGGAPGRGARVNCADCANLVTSFSNLAGAKLWTSCMGGWGFRTNPYTAIGCPPWTPPSWGASFRYHAVAWTGDCGDDDFVFDACLRYDGDGDPTTDPKREELPTGVQFSDGNSGAPFLYRERLSPPGAAGYDSCISQPTSRIRFPVR